MQNNSVDIIIIGAGASGLMCAQIAANRGQKVLILDHSQRLAEKIRISGGGRCNFTNLNAKAESYLSQNPHFATSALSRYTPHHFCELLDWHNISYHEKTLGQLFCDSSSQEIIDLLDHLCQVGKVTRLMATMVKGIIKTPQGFLLETTQGNFNCEKLVIASGGLAVPQIGATGFGYEVAKQFEINIIKPQPALVPLMLQPQELEYFNSLSGISFNSEVSIDKISFTENTLFTHRGLSGPAILQISTYWQPGQKIQINLLPEQDIYQEIISRRNSNKLLSNFLSEFFSQRLADCLCKLIALDKPLSQLSKSQIDLINQTIHQLKIISIQINTAKIFC